MREEEIELARYNQRHLASIANSLEKITSCLQKLCKEEEE